MTAMIHLTPTPATTTRVVGIGDLAVSSEQGMIVTHGLGSCIALLVYDPAVRVGGMLHFQLPDSSMDRCRAEHSPALFGDTGTLHLIKTAEALGASRRRCRVHLVGGAQVISSVANAEIGKRNHQSVRKALWKLGMLITGEDVGGSASRWVGIDLSNGSVRVRSQSKETVLP